MLLIPLDSHGTQPRSVETVTKLHIRNHIAVGKEAERNGNDALAAGHYEIALSNFTHPDLGALVMGRRGRPADYNEAAHRLAEVGKRLADRALERDLILIDEEDERLGRVHRRQIEGEPGNISWRTDGGALLYDLYANRYQDFHNLALSYARSMDGGPIKEYVRYWSREKRFRSVLNNARGRLKRLNDLLAWPPEKRYVTPQEQAGLEQLPDTMEALGRELVRQIENWLDREQQEFKGYSVGGNGSPDALIPSESEITVIIESTQAKKAGVGALKNAEDLVGVVRFFGDETGVSKQRIEAFQQRTIQRAVKRGDWLMERGRAEDAKDYYRLAKAEKKYDKAKQTAREQRDAQRKSAKKMLEDLKVPKKGPGPDIGKTKQERKEFEKEADDLADELGL
jgi:hypothetical protein